MYDIKISNLISSILTSEKDHLFENENAQIKDHLLEIKNIQLKDHKFGIDNDHIFIYLLYFLNFFLKDNPFCLWVMGYFLFSILIKVCKQFVYQKVLIQTFHTGFYFKIQLVISLPKHSNTNV